MEKSDASARTGNTAPLLLREATAFLSQLAGKKPSMKGTIREFINSPTAMELLRSRLVGILDEAAAIDRQRAEERAAVRAAELAEHERPLTPDSPIEHLDLQVRPYNCLKRDGIHTVGEVLAVPQPWDSARIRNMGDRSWNDVRERLTKRGVLLPDGSIAPHILEVTQEG